MKKKSYKKGDILNREGFLFIAEQSGKFDPDYPEFRLAKKKEIRDWNENLERETRQHRLQIEKLENGIELSKIQIKNLKKLLV